MYPLTCYGGYPMPLKAGKFEVVQIKATVDDLGADSRLRLVDDEGITSSKWGRVLADGIDDEVAICDLKGLANTVGDLRFTPHQSIKLRNGLSVAYCTNIVAGSIFIYVR